MKKFKFDRKLEFDSEKFSRRRLLGRLKFHFISNIRMSEPDETKVDWTKYVQRWELQKMPHGWRRLSKKERFPDDPFMHTFKELRERSEYFARVWSSASKQVPAVADTKNVLGKKDQTDITKNIIGSGEQPGPAYLAQMHASPNYTKPVY